MLVAGIDSSTQSTKVLLCQADDGAIVGIGHLPDAEIHWPSLDASPYAGQVWAIEVELTPKPLPRTGTAPSVTPNCGGGP